MIVQDRYRIASQIKHHKAFFNRTMSCFSEADARFRPQESMLSVAGQVDHVTCAIELMLSGVLAGFERFNDYPRISKRPGGSWLGWDMEWAKIANGESPLTDWSLSASLRAFNETMDTIQDVFSHLSDDEIISPLPSNPMNVTTPWFAFHVGMIDHTAHHRGALAQYARLCGLEPKIPYFEMSEVLHEGDAHHR